MYLTHRAAFIRNIALSAVNGTITLVILLIAPLGMAAVIANTILVTGSTFLVGSVGDWVVSWLLAPSYRKELLSARSRKAMMPRENIRDIDIYQDY